MNFGHVAHFADLGSTITRSFTWHLKLVFGSASVAKPLENLKVQISRQVRHFVNLQLQFSRKAQRFANLICMLLNMCFDVCVCALSGLSYYCISMFEMFGTTAEFLFTLHDLDLLKAMQQKVHTFMLWCIHLFSLQRSFCFQCHVLCWKPSAVVS